MAVSVVSSAISPELASTSSVATVTRPSLLAVGQLMVAQANARAGVTSITPPPGWSSIMAQIDNSTTLSSQLFRKTADASDVAAADFQFDIPSAQSFSVAITALTGHDATNPIVAATQTANGAVATVTVSGGVTPGVANCLLMFFNSHDDNDGTTASWAVANNNPATWTEEYDFQTAQGADSGIAMAYATYTATTSTGNATATQQVANRNTGHLIAIQPSTGTPSVAASNQSNLLQLMGVGN